jgi:hypothetical protein
MRESGHGGPRSILVSTTNHGDLNPQSGKGNTFHSWHPSSRMTLILSNIYLKPWNDQDTLESIKQDRSMALPSRRIAGLITRIDFQHDYSESGYIALALILLGLLAMLFKISWKLPISGSEDKKVCTIGFILAFTPSHLICLPS